jgi:hypothetical protein
MSFFDYVALVAMLLQREGRLTYRALQREFGFDAAWLDDMRRELIFRRIARDEQGEGLVWMGVMPRSGQSAAPEYAAQPAPEGMDLPPLHLIPEPLPPDAVRPSTIVSPIFSGAPSVADSEAWLAEPTGSNSTHRQPYPRPMQRRLPRSRCARRPRPNVGN